MSAKIYYWEYKKYFKRVKIVLTYFSETDLICDIGLNKFEKLKNIFWWAAKHTKRGRTNKVVIIRKRQMVFWKLL